jgi:hypothetical protein
VRQDFRNVDEETWWAGSESIAFEEGAEDWPEVGVGVQEEVPVV